MFLYKSPLDTPYLIVVCENSTTPGLTFIQVSASDLDSPPNNNIEFSLDDTSGLFSINSISGFITFESFIDFEITKWVSISIVASDGGDPQLTSYSNVSLYICDSNDNSPLFSTNNFGTIRTSENRTVGSVIFNVTVTDADSGNNGEISLFIDNVFPSECAVS